MHMPRVGLVFAVAFACFAFELVQAADSVPCAAEGRCHLKSATDSQLDREWTSLLQTYTESRTRIETKQINDEAVGAAGKPRRWSPAAQLLQTWQEPGKAKGKVVGGPAPQAARAAPLRQVIITSVVCGVAALLAGFVQAVLGVYNAITFHCVCALGASLDFGDFPMGVTRASLLIMCYQPIMDWVQIWHFRNEERNWYFIFGYGIPFLVGILCGLAVLRCAKQGSVAIGLDSFLLFSCAMVLLSELFPRIRMWTQMVFSGQAPPSSETLAPASKDPETTPREGTSSSDESVRCQRSSSEWQESPSLKKQVPGIKIPETTPQERSKVPETTPQEKSKVPETASQEGTSSSVEGACCEPSAKMLSLLPDSLSSKRQAPGSTAPETTPQEGTSAAVQSVCYEPSAKMLSEMQEQGSFTARSYGGTSVAESVCSEPSGVDMSKTVMKVVVGGCGLGAGFGAGAISVGGPFVVLMISSLQIPIAEWRVTACICEAPVHLTRLFLLLALGYVNWAVDGWLICGSIIGTVLGLIVGNSCAEYISMAFLRGVILCSVAFTIACLAFGLYNA